MGIIVNKDTERRTELSDRITTSLRERASQTSGRAETDYVDKSEYSKDLKQTGKYTWVWFVLILLAVISLVVIFLF